VQDSQRRLGRLMGNITCVSRLVALLATMRCGLSAAERQLLETFFCPELQEGGGGGAADGGGNGWEELVDASLTYLLKTALAKTAKEGTSLPGAALDHLPTELEGLLKHIQIVLDRLGKGARLLAASNT